MTFIIDHKQVFYPDHRDLARKNKAPTVSLRKCTCCSGYKSLADGKFVGPRGKMKWFCKQCATRSEE